ncbi:CBS domain-containing protein [Sulfurimonas aquatica]|uniref:CBS domain-containing protein n=1 Tax=Sulfurimonas aquatica TaxID=2672570 RepID=A0A975AY50_9BACT|nr:nucleotidyltransferase family protein [Sulfurimonas aquatica]QSZ40737.1 CBS domain-containing protein [Sulfurimonas aquatica]
MKSIDKIKLTTGSTIKEAMKAIDVGAMKIALVVDKDERLLGVLTDGDIRRALLGDMSFDSTVESIVQKNPLVCYINDSREDILAKAVGKKIYHMPILDMKDRVVGIEDIDSLLESRNRVNRVVLMVGGLGSRLRPLTEDTPKPMLKVGNKPILETIINNFKQYGFKDIILSVNYKADIVKSHFGDGSRFGVNIEYVYEDKRMGTAGALSLMSGKFDEPFFVMNGDLLTNVNFEHFLNFHMENDSRATMAVREYEYQVPYGVINQEEGAITSIVEKPIQRFYVNAGIYILDPCILKKIPYNIFYDMPTLFEDLIKSEKPPISFPVHEYWLDIGQMNELKQARDEYATIFEE